MLPYTAYIDALTAIGDAKSPEWDMTVAGLVVLRLVDEWFDSEPRSIAKDEVGLQHVRDLVEKVPDAQPLRSLLNGVLHAVQRADRADVPIVTPLLTRYTRELFRLGKMSLGEAALRPLQDRAMRSGDDRSIMRLSRELGLFLRRSGKLDEAMENYDIANRYAKKLGDIPSQLKIAGGRLKIIADRGNLDLADSMAVDTAIKAEALGHAQLQSMAAQDRGFIICRTPDPADSIPIFRKALACATKDHENILLDLIMVLTCCGSHKETLSDNLRLAVFARDHGVRCQATLNLMYSAYIDGDLQQFELYHSSLRLTSLVPGVAIRYHYIAGKGYCSFGQFSKADEEIRKARMIASRYGFRPPGLDEPIRVG